MENFFIYTCIYKVGKDYTNKRPPLSGNASACSTRLIAIES